MLTGRHPPAILQDVLCFLEELNHALSRADGQTLESWEKQAGAHAEALRVVVARFAGHNERDDQLPVHAALRAGALLSPRETQVLKLIARGHSNKEIAASLGLSVKTIEAHKANAAHRLGLYSRAAIVAHALAVGWLP